MANKLDLKVQTLHTQLPLEQSSTKSEEVSGKDGGRKVESLVKRFETGTSNLEKTDGPKTIKTAQLPKQHTAKVVDAPRLQRPGKIYTRPTVQPKTTEKTTPKDPEYEKNVQKFGSKTANLYQIENLGVKVPERSPIDTGDVLKHLLEKDTNGVIETSWKAMKESGKVDDKNLKKITDTIEKIFDEGYPFTKEQLTWIETTMKGKVIIARSTGDEDSADTPNAGGNESVLFVEPNKESVQKAMKEVVLSYFGADSLRNRIVGDGEKKVLEGLPKMPVLLMEMVTEPIKVKGVQEQGKPTPPIGIAMSTNKVEFTGGEDFHFVSISSAVGPGVNEGSGRIEVDETYVMQAKDGTPLLIYQHPSVKEERIRAVKGENGKISSQMEKNTTELKYNPSLSRDQIRELVTSTDKIKTLNDGKTTEVEGVVGGDGTINFVQHRPIPDPQSKVDPTYVNTERVKDQSQVFGFTTVVPKSGDALVITDWSQVCFAETMKEAESKFDWKGGKQKIVIVRQPDCSNSHPAVNFGSYKKDVGEGKKEPNPIPCLVVPNYGQLLALSKKSAISGTKPFVVDGQSQKLHLWKDDSFKKEDISAGRISHHIGLETSVKEPTIVKLVGDLKKTASKDMALLTGDLTKVIGQYETAIKNYETLLTKNADTIHNSEGLKLRLETVKGNLAEVKNALNKVVTGDEKYTFDPETHARLLLVKFFESSMHDVHNFQKLIDEGKTASMYLRAAKGSPIDAPKFADQVNNAVKDGLTGPLALKWKRVLTLAEQSNMSPKEIANFKAMMEDLDKLGVTANWMSTVFDQKYDKFMPTDRLSKTPAAPSARKLIKALVKDYQATSGVLGKQQALLKGLAEVERNVADFATPSKFDKSFENLKALAQPFIDEPWPKDLDKRPLEKAVRIQTLGRLIEVFDGSIKSLKSSTERTDLLVDKELQMLDSFKDLFESLFSKIDYKVDTPTTKPIYLNGLNSAVQNIKGEVSKVVKEELGKTVKDELSKTGVEKLEEHSRVGGSFNVINALFNTGGKVMPGNVEELFTTLHQGLEDIRSGLMVGGSNYNIDMPKEMQHLLGAIPKLAMQTKVKRPGVLVGREITPNGVTYTYNMQVLDHGTKIRAIYEKPKTGETQGKLWIEVDYYAANDGDRLKNMAELAKQFRFGNESLDDPTRREVSWGEKQMKVKYEVRNELDVNRAVTVLNNLSAYSILGVAGSPKNYKALRFLVETSNDFTTGLLPEKRQLLLNDFLNVSFGSVVGSPGKDKRLGTTDYKVALTPSKDEFTVNIDGKDYKLDLGKKKFGLDDTVFDKIPPKDMEKLEQEVVEGTRKFSFEANGKKYAVDLNKDDLGLGGEALKELRLNPKYLGDLKNELSLAWENALVEFKTPPDPNKVEPEGGSFRLQTSWSQLMFGKPMAYSQASKFPELDLWKSASAMDNRSKDIQKIDQSFEKVLAKKYEVHDLETKIAEKGAFATHSDRKALAKAMQGYYLEISRLERIANGFLGKTFDRGINFTIGTPGKALDLLSQTSVEKKAIENQLQVFGLKPKGLSKMQLSRLPFSSYELK